MLIIFLTSVLLWADSRLEIVLITLITFATGVYNICVVYHLTTEGAFEKLST